MPRAEFREAEVPLGFHAGWVPLTRLGRNAEGGEFEATLHVVQGRLVELELWAYEYGKPVRATESAVSLS